MSQNAISLSYRLIKNGQPCYTLRSGISGITVTINVGGGIRQGFSKPFLDYLNIT